MKCQRKCTSSTFKIITRTHVRQVESQRVRHRDRQKRKIKRYPLLTSCNAFVYYVLIKRNKIFQRSLRRRIHHGSMCFMLLFFLSSKSWSLQSNIFCVFFSNCLRSWGLWYWSVMVETSSHLSRSLSLFVQYVVCVLAVGQIEKLLRKEEGWRMLLAGSNQSNNSYLLYWW